MFLNVNKLNFAKTKTKTKQKRVFQFELSAFVNFCVYLAKNRAFLPAFGVFRKVPLQFCEIHVVSASLQRFGFETGKSDRRHSQKG